MDSAKVCYYSVLGIEKTANEQAIKRSYRELALKWHPDKNPDSVKEAEEKFKEIGEAYSVISNPEKRKRYDRYGHEGVDDPLAGFDNPFDLFFSFFQDSGETDFLSPSDFDFFLKVASKAPPRHKKKTVGRKNKGGAKGSAKMEAMMMDALGLGNKKNSKGKDLFGLDDDDLMDMDLDGMEGMEGMEAQIFMQMMTGLVGGLGPSKNDSKKGKSKTTEVEEDEWEDDDGEEEPTKQDAGEGGDNEDDWEDEDDDEEEYKPPQHKSKK